MLNPLRIQVTRWRLAFQRPGWRLDPVVLRGALLLQYRRMVCPRERWNDPCPECPHLAECSYGQVFAARPSGMTVLTRNTAVPRPYVFRADPQTPDGFVLVLVGNAAALFPRIRRIFEKLGPRGLRRGDPPFTVDRISQLTPGGEMAIPDHTPPPLHPLQDWVPEDLPGALTLRFLTPTGIVARGRPVERPEPGPVIRRMRDRLSSLAAAWCGSCPDWDFRTIGDLADAVTLERSRTRWIRRRRTSGRTGASYSLSGFIGEADWREIPNPLRPIIAGCSLLGVGKRCAFGNGNYTIAPQG